MSLGEDEAEAHVYEAGFNRKPSAQVGVEMEWLIVDPRDARQHIPADRTSQIYESLRASNALPGGSKVTREPGGQIELSSQPFRTLAECVEALATDLDRLREATSDAGVALLGCGVDPYREPPRLLDQPRYRAMEAFFDRGGPWGRIMMRRSASLQFNLDSGDDTHGTSGYKFRWELAHRLGPVLVAAFANSPVLTGRPTGWLSTRQAVWSHMDAGRTREPRYQADPAAAWSCYALDANVLAIPGAEDTDWTAPADLTFREWIRGRAPSLRRPTLADLDYHLTTLFPPIRPRGWLELRMTDAQDGDDWVIPALLTATLLNDAHAADAAAAATELLCQDAQPVPTHEVWTRAARCGLADPDLAKAAIACFTAAESALVRSNTPPKLLKAFTDFAERYTVRGQSPAHDRLKEWRHAETEDRT
ncbi:ergothioneine biosynthesis glutamate--cysteine ligase EgtA [Streptomyces sp. NPDC002205]|uniref:ergothioneine biosynthesis glutamate--cysteine ligase EgtA n=1 Tax=Streptomyces sp. NPDC002205 TaxID=3154411 RepID=UPI00333496BB